MGEDQPRPGNRGLPDHILRGAPGLRKTRVLGHAHRVRTAELRPVVGSTRGSQEEEKETAHVSWISFATRTPDAIAPFIEAVAVCSPAKCTTPSGLLAISAVVLLADSEKGVASSHPGVFVPVLDGGALPELGRLGPDSGHFRESGLEAGILRKKTELLGVGARGEAHEDAARPGLIDRHMVDAPEHGVGEDPLADASRLVPEPLPELHRHFHHLPVAERVDDLRLLGRERRRELDVAQHFERKSQDELRRAHRRKRPALLEPDFGAVRVVDDPSHRAAIENLVRESAREGLRQLVVSAQDPSFVHVLVESALVHPAHHQSVGRHLVGPRGRLRGVQVGVEGDDVPRRAFFEKELDRREVVELLDFRRRRLPILDHGGEPLDVLRLLTEELALLRPLEGEGCGPVLDRFHRDLPPADENTVVELGGQDLEPELLAVEMIVLVRRVDVLRAHLGVEPVGEGVTIGANAPTGTGARFENGDAVAGFVELVRRRESGEPGADHENARSLRGLKREGSARRESRGESAARRSKKRSAIHPSLLDPSAAARGPGKRTVSMKRCQSRSYWTLIFFAPEAPGQSSRAADRDPVVDIVVYVHVHVELFRRHERAIDEARHRDLVVHEPVALGLRLEVRAHRFAEEGGDGSFGRDHLVVPLLGELRFPRDVERREQNRNARAKRLPRRFGVDPEVELGVGCDVSASIRERSDGASHDDELLHLGGEPRLLPESDGDVRERSEGHDGDAARTRGDRPHDVVVGALDFGTLPREAARRGLRGLVRPPLPVVRFGEIALFVNQRHVRSAVDRNVRRGRRSREAGGRPTFPLSRLSFPATVVMPRISTSGD